MLATGLVILATGLIISAAFIVSAILLKGWNISLGSEYKQQLEILSTYLSWRSEIQRNVMMFCENLLFLNFATGVYREFCEDLILD